jgi:glucose-6-phosphate 1-dehydrogenase
MVRRSESGDPGRADALVLFGATGDLAQRKIFPAVQAMIAHGVDLPIVGVARSDKGRDGLVQRIAEGLERFGYSDDRHARDRLIEKLRFVDGDYRDAGTFERLQEALKDCKRPLCYLAIPPSLFETVILGLRKTNISSRARVVVEKPFGRDLASARSLNRVLRENFEESSVFRIDHYLGKESVQNLLYFRFANAFLEPIWNRNYVSRVTVMMMESFGVEGRGKFYEEVGAIRDVVQNHLLQVVAHLAMEPPVSRGVDALRDEKAKVLRSIRALTGRSLVRGQFDGYRREAGVAPDSNVETFAAMQLHLDSWRWAGVPFFIRAGKCLATTATEVLVELKHPPQAVFDEPPGSDTNYFRFRLGPDQVSIAVGARAKKPGMNMLGEELELYVCNGNEDEMGAYERLIGDALGGDPTLFTREDAVLEAWRIVDPLLKLTTPVHIYEPGSYGPASAESLGRPRPPGASPAPT